MSYKTLKPSRGLVVHSLEAALAREGVYFQTDWNPKSQSFPVGLVSADGSPVRGKLVDGRDIDLGLVGGFGTAQVSTVPERHQHLMQTLTRLGILSIQTATKTIHCNADELTVVRQPGTTVASAEAALNTSAEKTRKRSNYVPLQDVYVALTKYIAECSKPALRTDSQVSLIQVKAALDGFATGGNLVANHPRAKSLEGAQQTLTHLMVIDASEPYSKESRAMAQAVELEFGKFGRDI